MDTVQSSPPTFEGSSRAMFKITPLNAEAKLEFSKVVEWLQCRERLDGDSRETSRHDAARIHARKYIHIENSPVKDVEVASLILQRRTGCLSASPPCSSRGDQTPANKPHVSPCPTQASSDAPSPAQPSNDTTTAIPCIWTGYYLLDLDMPPHRPARGWSVGRLRSDDQLNDIILSLDPDPLVMARQSHAMLQLSNMGCMTVRGSANAICHVDSTILTREGGRASTSAQHIRGSAPTLTFGKLQYQATYQPAWGESDFQNRANTYLQRYLDQQVSPLWPLVVEAPGAGTGHDAARATVTIGQWKLTGVGTLGSGATGRVSIGVNKDNQIAALKRIAIRGNRNRLNRRRKKLEIITQLAREQGENRVLLLREFLQDDAANGTNVAMDAWFVLEPVVSATLADACEAWSEKTLITRLRASRRVLFEVAGAVDFLHRNGWIHGDLKPLNIGVRDRNAEPFQIVLLDMDEIFRVPGQGQLYTEGPGNTGGTIGWLSPEREMDGYDESCDVWSLGVLTLWLVNGTHPWPMAVNPWQPGDEFVGHRGAFDYMYYGALIDLVKWHDRVFQDLTEKMLRFPYSEDRDQKLPRITVAEVLAALDPEGSPEAKRRKYRLG